MPLVALTGDPFSAVSLSLARILGVFAGVGIAIGLLQLDLDLLPLVALALLLGTLAGIPLRVGERANVQAAVSALFLVGFAHTGAVETGVARIWETAIGAGVAVAVAALVWPPDPVRELRLRLERLRQELAADLAAIAADLATGLGAATEQLEELREHSREAMRDVFELDRARRALRWNPLRRADAPELEELERRIHLAARLYRHARALARDVADATVTEPRLAAATRTLAEAADLALRGLPADEPLDRADEQLLVVEEGDAAIVRAQLVQLLADLRALAVGG